MSLELDKLLSRPHKSSHESKLSQVRRVILTDGLPDTVRPVYYAPITPADAL